jgi:hypothetical protein
MVHYELPTIKNTEFGIGRCIVGSPQVSDLKLTSQRTKAPQELMIALISGVTWFDTIG